MDVRFFELVKPSAESQPGFLATVLVIVGVLFSCLYRLKASSSHAKRLPPGSLGLPILGETIGLLRAQKKNKTQEWIDAKIAKYGPIFKTSLFGIHTVLVTGSAGNRFIFTAKESSLSNKQPSTITSIMGKYNIFELTGHEHKMIRGAMTKFLKPESVRRYIGEMDSILKQHLFKESEGKDCVKMVPFIKRITFNVTCAVLFQLPIGKEQDRLFEDFTIALRGLWSLSLNIPMTAFNRAIAARRRIYNYFSVVIKERRKAAEENAGHQNDAISAFIHLRNENGEILLDDMVIDNLLTLIIASHDTSTVLLSHLVRLLARNKAIYNCIVEEQERILREKEGTDGRLTWDDVQKMSYTWRVAQEVMRITPPVFGNFKRVIKDTSFGGFDIPKGWQVYWVTSSTHMDESIFPEPEKLDPSRFEDAAKSSYPPYTYIPFGAGPRICPGSDFARLEVLLIVHHLVTNYDWSEMIPDEPITRSPMPYPAMGLPVKLHPKKKLQDVGA